MLSDAIVSLGATSYTVTRRTSGGFSNKGRSIAPATSSETIVGLLQPLSGNSAEISRLPEGLHQKELRAFWTTGTLVPPDSDANTVGDHITASGCSWEVVSISEWSDLAGYTRYIVSRVDP